MHQPSLDVDLFSEEALLDPWPRYEAIRDAGPAVYLERYDMWALARYAEIRSSLRDWQTFSSAQGTALNAAAGAGTWAFVPSPAAVPATCSGTRMGTSKRTTFAKHLKPTNRWRVS